MKFGSIVLALLYTTLHDYHGKQSLSDGRSLKSNQNSSLKVSFNLNDFYLIAITFHASLPRPRVVLSSTDLKRLNLASWLTSSRRLLLWFVDRHTADLWRRPRRWRHLCWGRSRPAAERRPERERGRQPREDKLQWASGRPAERPEDKPLWKLCPEVQEDREVREVHRRP